MSDRAALYPRVLRLRHVHPNAWQRAALGEGAVAVAGVLVLADLATAWSLLVLPVAVAAVVKAHDVVAGVLARGGAPGADAPVADDDDAAVGEVAHEDSASTQVEHEGAASEEVAYEDAASEQVAYEEPVVAYEEPSVAQAAVEGSSDEGPLVEQLAQEELAYEEPGVDQGTVEGPAGEDPLVEQFAQEELAYEAPGIEDPSLEDGEYEDPSLEDCAAEEVDPTTDQVHQTVTVEAAVAGQVAGATPVEDAAQQVSEGSDAPRRRLFRRAR
ncbi:MAG: hypothetical protein JWM64_2795 [Frankiales bacterium]|nr:hypothetical protein [Frankiales bacterium]